MRKLIYLLIFIFSFGVVSAQEQLSKEEKERREKNIQAGNPFARFGYKAKVATLSKGKYLEVHDLDSIVTIGTVRWHVDKEQIVGRIVEDTLNIDAQPIGDRAGRWMSPDPLSEEFPSWSPYNMCFDNPMKYVDPDGRAANDWRNLAGNQVYDPVKGEYTKYATAEDIAYGDALRNSGAEGAKQFDALTKSEAKITVDFQEGNSPTIEGQMGYTKITGIGKNSDGSDKLLSAKISIYKGEIAKIHAGIMDGSNEKTKELTDQQKLNNRVIKDNHLSKFDMTIGVFGHEIGHTQEGNVQTRLRETSKLPPLLNVLDSEFNPQRIQGRILTDIANMSR